MQQLSTNPLINLTLEELNTFLIAIDKNFQVTTIKGEIKEDLETRWSNLYDNCVKYAYWNHEKITEGYPKMEERTFGHKVKIMILKEIDKRK